MPRRAQSWDAGRVRAASVDELRALAHPTRQRILRLCLEEPLTNQQLAKQLGLQPATTLRHVRILVAQGFLAAEEVRSGNRGALERPYRATRLTRRLELAGADAELVRRKDIAALRAHISELSEAPPSGSRELARGTMRLNERSRAELAERLNHLLGEFAARKDGDGDPLAFIWSLVSRAATARPPVG